MAIYRWVATLANRIRHAAPIEGGHDVQTRQSGSPYVLPDDDSDARPMVARDDRRFANSPLKPWFDSLASGNGLCCSFTDGSRVQDVDWDTQDGHIVCEYMDNGSWCLMPPL